MSICMYTVDGVEGFVLNSISSTGSLSNCFQAISSVSELARRPIVVYVLPLLALVATASVTSKSTPASGQPASWPCATFFVSTFAAHNGWLFHVVEELMSPVRQASTGRAEQFADQISSVRSVAEWIILLLTIDVLNLKNDRTFLTSTNPS